MTGFELQISGVQSDRSFFALLNLSISTTSYLFNCPAIKLLYEIDSRKTNLFMSLFTISQKLLRNMKVLV